MREKRASRGRRRRRVKFHQLLLPNSSGSYYNHAENGLIAVDAMHMLELLREAKDILFPTMSAPVDTEMRRQLIPVAEPGAHPLLNRPTNWISSITEEDFALLSKAAEKRWPDAVR